MGGIKGDFTGFTYGGIHSSELGLTRVSDGNRYNENLAPTATLKTTAAPGGDFTFLFNKLFTQKQFSINVAFDSMTELQHRRFQKLMTTKTPMPLIFDEFPYKEYYAIVTGTPTMKSICFDDSNGDRIYKGEGTIQLTCYTPFARIRHNKEGKPLKYLEQYNNNNIPAWDSWYDTEWYNNNDWQWDESSGLLTRQDKFDKVTGSVWKEDANRYENAEHTFNGINYNTIPKWSYTMLDGAVEIPVYNPGDLPADYTLTLEKPYGFDLIVELAFYPNMTINKLFQYDNPTELIKEVWGSMSYTTIINNDAELVELSPEQLSSFQYMTDLLTILGGDPVAWWQWWGKIISRIKEFCTVESAAYSIKCILKRLSNLAYDGIIQQFDNDTIINEDDVEYFTKGLNTSYITLANVTLAIKKTIKALVEDDSLGAFFSITDEVPPYMNGYIDTTMPPAIGITLVSEYEQLTHSPMEIQRYKIKDMSKLQRKKGLDLARALNLNFGDSEEDKRNLTLHLLEQTDLLKKIVDFGPEHEEYIEQQEGDPLIQVVYYGKKLFENLAVYEYCDNPGNNDIGYIDNLLTEKMDYIKAFLNDDVCTINSELGLLLSSLTKEPTRYNVINDYLEGRIFKIPENLEHIETRIRIYAVKTGTFTPMDHREPPAINDPITEKIAYRNYIYKTNLSGAYQIEYDYLYL